ncbi:probable BRO1 domain-containing protein BROX [Coccomyxa sp. Obi]|nr:probable BRO1 domain-containing protein BROX [Coccomyxa sp. Obi]
MEVLAPKETAPQHGGTSVDRLVIHPHLLKPRLKPSAATADFASQLRQHATSKQGKTLAQEYVAALGSARQAFLIKADTPGTSDVEAALDQKAEEYIALLLGLINALPKTPESSKDVSREANSPASLPHPEGNVAEGAVEATPKADAGAASNAVSSSTPSNATAPPVVGDSKLRRSVAFTWKDVMVSSPVGESTAQDAIFELASVLEAVALWKMARAATLCADARFGIGGEAVSEAYKLLRAAAGLFEFVRDHCATFLINAVASPDCNVQTAQAYALLCIAEAQSLTVLRAIQKGNAPSLIASLAVDAAAAFESAAGTARGVAATKADSKFKLYADYQAAVHRAYGQCFAGVEQLKAQQAGAALRHLGNAKDLLAASQAASKAYDRADPVSSAVDHEYADLELKDAIEKPYTRAKRDNDSVYFQHVPTADSLAAIEPRRLVTPTPYALPAPALLVNEALPDAFVEVPAEKADKLGGAPAASAAAVAKPGTEEKPAGGKDDDKAKAKGGAWWQWLLVIIAMPLLLIVSLVGAVVWVLLLPLKCFCCPIGCAAQLIWNVVEWLLKAPLRGMLWASGKPWQPHKDAEPEKDDKDKNKHKAAKDKTPPV